MLTVFYSKIMPFFTISNHYKKNTRSSRLVLYFDTYACLIFLILLGTYIILRAIDLLFSSNFSQSFLWHRKSFSFQLYWSIKGLIFDIFSEWVLICSWFNAAVKACQKHLSSLFFGFIVFFLFFKSFRRICIWSSSI